MANKADVQENEDVVVDVPEHFISSDAELREILSRLATAPEIAEVYGKTHHSTVQQHLKRNNVPSGKKGSGNFYLWRDIESEHVYGKRPDRFAYQEHESGGCSVYEKSVKMNAWRQLTDQPLPDLEEAQQLLMEEYGVQAVELVQPLE